MATDETKPKHTPGPWQAFGLQPKVRCDKGTKFALIDAGGMHIAWCPDNHYTVNRLDAEANAELMAAAPELLESLRNIIGLAEESVEARRNSDDYEDIEMLDVYDQHIREARDAIAKAEGLPLPSEIEP